MVYDKKISSLKKDHPFIYALAKKRLNGNNSDGLANFIWSNTIEGQVIWSDVCHDKYESFYNYHNRINPMKNIAPIMLSIYSK